jgi:XTP/dITP diphosphohydrolase
MSKNVGDTLTGHNPTVYFVTGNQGKFSEASLVASHFGIKFKHLRAEKREIQSGDIEEIACFAAREAAHATGRFVVAEDAGFFVNALAGFPGPYSSYVFKTLGTHGILKLMKTRWDRVAFFQASVAFCTPTTRPRSFTGRVYGRVGRKPKGTHGFGFDPIFIPSRGDGRSFAEMTTEEKNALSHRALAFAKFCKWFLARRARSASA